jgi:hypothetical protein
MSEQIALDHPPHHRNMPSPGTPAAKGMLVKLFTYKVFIAGLLLILAGTALLVVSAITPEAESGNAGVDIFTHITRDIGITLLTTGIILLPFDYFVRKEFLTLVGETVKDAFATDLDPRFDDIRKCIALSDGLRSLGVEQIFEQRTHVNLAELLAGAKPGSEIRLLGIVISDLASPAIQKIVTHKLDQGCKIKILCLSPDSRCVAERAVEEGREEDEMRADLLGMRAIHNTFVTRRLGGSGGKIELRYYDASPRYFIFSAGRAMVFSLYTGRIRGASATHFRLQVKQGGFSDQLIDHFDWLWNHAQPTSPAPGSTPPA